MSYYNQDLVISQENELTLLRTKFELETGIDKNAPEGWYLDCNEYFNNCEPDANMQLAIDRADHHFGLWNWYVDKLQPRSVHGMEYSDTTTLVKGTAACAYDAMLAANKAYADYKCQE